MSLPRSALSLLVAAALAQGCFLLDSPNGVRGAGGSFSDDDDDGPAENPYEACFVIWDWYFQQEPLRFHRIYVAALVDDWRTGALAFGADSDDPFAALFYGIESGSGAVATYVTTNGQAYVQTESSSLGEPLSLSIDSPPLWSLVAGTGAVAMGGTGGADAFLNDVEDCFGNGNAEDCLFGFGDIAIAVGTTNLSIGSSSNPGDGAAFAYCEDLSGFSGSFRDRALLRPSRRPRSRRGLPRRRAAPSADSRSPSPL